MMPEFKSHKQKWVDIDGSRVLVDVAILPLVNWINKQDGLTTTFSCAGSISQNGESLLPYVALRVSKLSKVFFLDRHVESFMKKEKFDGIIRIEESKSYCQSWGKKNPIKSRHISFTGRSLMKQFTKFLESSGK